MWEGDGVNVDAVETLPFELPDHPSLTSMETIAIEETN